MGLNKQNGNMYDFVTHTWNVIKGKCSHACTYCYMKNFALKPIRFDESELKTDLGHGNFIFVGSGTDMFAEDVPSEWIERVLEHCRKFDNTYLFQSKNPGRFLDLIKQFPKEIVLGTTIETNKNCMGISVAPLTQDRADALGALSELGIKTMVTIEPIMEFNLSVLVAQIKNASPAWVNIGADSKGNKLPEPSYEQIKELITELSEFTEVKQKRNLGRLQR